PGSDGGTAPEDSGEARAAQGGGGRRRGQRPVARPGAGPRETRESRENRRGREGRKDRRARAAKEIAPGLRLDGMIWFVAAFARTRERPTRVLANAATNEGSIRRGSLGIPEMFGD